MSLAKQSGLNPMVVGYCTNVHPGHDLATTQLQLSAHATAVREILGQDALAVGLWLSRNTATQLLADNDGVAKFYDWLHDRRLVPYTLNGFPFGDFHQPVVKHGVYLPTWADPSRLSYTLDLAKILAGLLVAQPPSGPNQRKLGTISTLPLGWPTDHDPVLKEQASVQLKQLTEGLAAIEDRSGVRIDVCLEPEPGCVLGDMTAMVHYFQQYLLNGNRDSQERILRYLSVCYDVCHAGVMHEESRANVAQSKAAGIRMGKVQVSSALEVDFDQLTDAERQSAWATLHEFSEPKYLHQTVVYQAGHSPRFFEDLPLALQDGSVQKQGCWTVHFHVPISDANAGLLGTTQRSILELIQAAAEMQWLPTHWEVETYAWNVLPAELRADSLAAGIAREIAALQAWLHTMADRQATT